MASEDVVKRERDLIRKRATYKSRLRTFARWLDSRTDIEHDQAEQLAARTQKLERDLEAFGEIHDALEEIASDEMFETRLAERMEFEETHHEVLGRANSILGNSRHSKVTPIANEPSSRKQPLPRTRLAQTDRKMNPRIRRYQWPPTSTSEYPQ